MVVRLDVGIQTGKLLSKRAQQVLHAGKDGLGLLEDDMLLAHQGDQPVVVELPVAEELRGDTLFVADEREQQVGGEDLVAALFQGLVRRAAHEGGRAACRPDQALVASRGLEIYAVGLAADKTDWATVVKSQNLPWINVYDRTGVSTVNYNLSDIPASFLISEGNLEVINGEAGLRRQLDRLLK